MLCSKFETKLEQSHIKKKKLGIIFTCTSQFTLAFKSSFEKPTVGHTVYMRNYVNYQTFLDVSPRTEEAHVALAFNWHTRQAN